MGLWSGCQGLESSRTLGFELHGCCVLGCGTHPPAAVEELVSNSLPLPQCRSGRSQSGNLFVSLRQRQPLPAKARKQWTGSLNGSAVHPAVGGAACPWKCCVEDPKHTSQQVLAVLCAGHSLDGNKWPVITRVWFWGYITVAIRGYEALLLDC